MKNHKVRINKGWANLVLVGVLAGSLTAAEARAEIGKSALQAPLDSLAVDSLLVHIGRAYESVSYSGIQRRVLRHNGESLEIKWREYHWSPERTLINFIAPEEMAGTQLVLQGRKARKHRVEGKEDKLDYRYHPRRLFKNGRIFREIALLRQNYRIHAVEGPPYENRPTISLDISSHYPGRPTLEALVDAETGLLLRSRRVPSESVGETIAEISEFSEITFGPPEPALFTRAWMAAEPIKSRRKTETFADLDALRQQMDAPLLNPTDLPPGFALRRIKSIEKKNKAFLHFLYGDGLTVVSFFQHRHSDSTSSEKSRKKRNDKDIPFTIIRGSQAGIAYSLAGEIPRHELQQMAASLELIHPPGQKWRNLPLYVALALITISLFTYASKRRREKIHA